MPKEIDCPDCKEKGLWNLNCSNCGGNGKITVYTQEEVDLFVEAEREAIITLFNIYMESDNMTANLLIKLIRARSK